jgi:hypothetical protein
VSFASNSLTFTTQARNATPPDQTIAFTVTGVPSGRLGYKVEQSAASYRLVGVQLASTDTGGMFIFSPQSAASQTVGSNTATITISVCLDDASCNNAGSTRIGSPQVITINYVVAPSVQGDTVSPRVAAANKAGDVILRGRGFANASSVRFGTSPASVVGPFGLVVQPTPQ